LRKSAVTSSEASRRSARRKRTPARRPRLSSLTGAGGRCGTRKRNTMNENANVAASM
jgi:hypothetical protein